MRIFNYNRAIELLRTDPGNPAACFYEGQLAAIQPIPPLAPMNSKAQCHNGRQSLHAMPRLLPTAGIVASIAITLSSISAAAFAEPLKFKFDRGRPWGGEGGATGIWQGVVVEVEGNTVIPKFAIQRRIFVNWWVDLPAQKIQACPLAQDGFSSSSNYLTAEGKSIAIPEGTAPFDYSYKFLSVSEKGGTSEESFRLDRPVRQP